MPIYLSGYSQLGPTGGPAAYDPLKPQYSTGAQTTTTGQVIQPSSFDAWTPLSDGVYAEQLQGANTSRTPTYRYADGSTAGSAADVQGSAEEQAYWNDQLAEADRQLGRLGGQRQAGYTNIDNSYRSAFDALTGERGKAERDYGVRRDQTVQDNQTAKANINRSVRGRNTSLQRLLGSAGSGSSSAADVLAPYASALVGNQQRQQVQTTYGRNIGALDTGWKDTEEKFQGGFRDLETQKATRRNELESGFATTEAQLLEQKQNAAMQKAQAAGQSYTQARAAREPYRARIDQLLNRITELGVNPNIAAQKVDVSRPDLAQYTYDRYGAPTSGSNVNPGMAGNVGSFWTLLNQDKDKERQTA